MGIRVISKEERRTFLVSLLQAVFEFGSIQVAANAENTEFDIKVGDDAYYIRQAPISKEWLFGPKVDDDSAWWTVSRISFEDCVEDSIPFVYEQVVSNEREAFNQRLEKALELA